MTIANLLDAPVFDNGGITMRSLAVPSRGSSELAIWSFDMAPGAAGAEHTVDREEVFVAQSGRIVGVLGGVEHVIEAGDALIVAPNIPFSLRNDSQTERATGTVCTSAGIKATLNGQTILPPWAQ
ncbi:cupin domain-containing protein [Streptosporangium sp. NPDC051023]|uniref:cupin domain-containing protein n=1 Tax=Streptosporangium sp. NPDC051023 TaxID=3155410 RepID=UPI00344FDF7F